METDAGMAMQSAALATDVTGGKMHPDKLHGNLLWSTYDRGTRICWARARCYYLSTFPSRSAARGKVELGKEV